ncbi:MAG: hypothetical protein KDK27_16530, partial [Leptospiraceae bacterium]|nr:hypothetical protein [Leptospiraceae bacterium]
MIVPDSQDSNFKQSNPGQFSLLVYADCSPLPPDYLTTCGFPQTLAPFIITSADRDASKSQIPPTEFQQVSKSVLHHREISIGPHIDRLYGRQMDTISGFTLYN